MYDAADDDPIYDDYDVNDNDNTQFDDSEDDNEDEFSVPAGLICPYCGSKSPNRTTIIHKTLVWVCSECFIDILKFETARRRGKTIKEDKQEFIQ